MPEVRPIDAGELEKVLFSDRKFAIYDGSRIGVDDLLIKISAVQQIIRDAPVLDAEPVVRCNECAHRGNPDICPWSHKELRKDGEDGWQWVITDHAVHNGFCHRGTKQNGGT